MSDIFISYDSEDRVVANSLADALTTRGWSVWWDREITPGAKYRDVIETELATARCVLVLWSVRSVVSDWVRAEADAARQRGCLIPIRLDDALPPLVFREIQTVSLEHWSGDTSGESFETLINGVLGLLHESATPAVSKRPGRQRGPSTLDWVWIATMAAGAFLTVYVLPSSFLEDVKVKIISQLLMWGIVGGLLFRALQSLDALAAASRSAPFRITAATCVTLPWLFVFDLAIVRPTLAPPDLPIRVSVDGEDKALPIFRTRLKNSAIVLSAEDGKSEFRLSATDMLWTFWRFGSRWRVIEPEWRLIYNVDVDCFGQSCPVPSSVTFTLDGRFDNHELSSPTDEGKAIRFDSATRIPVALHAGQYTVTMTVNGEPCATPLEPLAIPYSQSYYQIRAGQCSGTARK